MLLYEAGGAGCVAPTSAQWGSQEPAQVLSSLPRVQVEPLARQEVLSSPKPSQGTVSSCRKVGNVSLLITAPIQELASNVSATNGPVGESPHAKRQQIDPSSSVCYLIGHPPPPTLFYFACNMQWKRIGVWNPLPLGAYLTNGRTLYNTKINAAYDSYIFSTHRNHSDHD